MLDLGLLNNIKIWLFAAAGVVVAVAVLVVARRRFGTRASALAGPRRRPRCSRRH